jgi:ABC-type transport system involved in multi-copper enzyme maturation permease subunit
MLFGPVFPLELSTVLRRRRTFVLRVLYGLLLLVFFCIPLYVSGLAKAGELPHRELARLVEAFGGSVMEVQALAVLVLTPALVAGSLAQERASGKIDLLMASPLSSLEIILGKLVARYVPVVMLIGLALPVLGILSLFGGLDLLHTVLSDAILLATGLLIAATAMAVSLVSTRPGRAITATYVIAVGWMAVPFLIERARKFNGGLVGWLAQWAWPLESALGLTNPMYVTSHRGADPRALAWVLIVTMGVQVGLSLVLVAGSAAMLRPWIRGAGLFGWRVAPLSFLLSRRHLLPRPRCGEKPMAWKECHSARTTLLFRFAAALGVLGAVIPLGRLTWDYAAPAFAELRDQGYGLAGVNSARNELNEFLRVTMVGLYILMGLALAARSATSITIEKEKGTWASLLVTPMHGAEIVIGKLIGAFWGLRWLGLLYVGFLALGLAASAIHPLAGVFSALLTAAFFGFVAVLGIVMSLRARSSLAALAATLLVLFALNLLPMGCAVLIGPSTPLPFLFISPLVLVVGLASYEEVDQFFHGQAPPEGNLTTAVILFPSLVLHAVSALVLLRECLLGFEIDADRPRRNHASKRRVRRA